MAVSVVATTMEMGEGFTVTQAGHVAEGRRGEFVQAVRLHGDCYPEGVNHSTYYITLLEGSDSAKWFNPCEITFDFEQAAP